MFTLYNVNWKIHIYSLWYNKNNKEIFNVLSNPIEGIDYFAVTEGDNYELYNVDGVYTIFSKQDYNIQSVADKFPEQVKNVIRFDEASDDSTFVSFNM